MKENSPPKWIDWFLSWYCNPSLLEEIQGDLYELYAERLEKEGRWSADLKYLWDTLRCFRWSNIKRKSPLLNNRQGLWRLSFTLALRHAQKNKTGFLIKTLGLSICLSFALLLTAFVVNELTFDHFHVNHKQIYRVSSRVTFENQVTHYAVTPFPIGAALKDAIPEIENYFRFTYEEKPIYYLGDKIFYDEATFIADSNFLKVLSYRLLAGNDQALSEPDKIVLTESLARKFFGNNNALGQVVEYGEGFELEVAAIIEDPPANSHLRFDALISWDTFDHYDEWANLNAYNYLLVGPEVSVTQVKDKVSAEVGNFHDLIVREYNGTFEAMLENIAEIHFSQNLEEDIAEKRNKRSVLLLIAAIVLLFITGLINYLNLTLTELTGSIKKMSILGVFGGLAKDHRKMLTSETAMILSIVLPLVAWFGYYGLWFAETHMSTYIDRSVLMNPILVSTGIGFLLLVFASNHLNLWMLSGPGYLIRALKGRFNTMGKGISLRKVLVAGQMSFSIIMIALIIIIVDQFNFIENADKGFDNKDIMVVKLRSPNPAGMESFSQAIRQMDGVVQVAGSSYFPGIIETKYVFQIETESGMKQQLISMMNCSVEYFKTLNIQFDQGHGFYENRVLGHEDGFIINEAAAKAFGWEKGVGKIINGPLSGQNEAYQSGKVIGVVKDFNFATLHETIEPMIIFLSDDNWTNPFIYIKTSPIHQADLITWVEKEFKTLWPQYPFEWEYLDTKYLSLYKKDYELKSIFEVGLVISILISCLGIFSISALLGTLRSKEMGIRKVVGAAPSQLFFLHLKNFLQFLMMAMLVAYPLVWYLSDQWLQNFAYHVVLNGWNYIMPGIFALLIILITAGYQGIKSAMINPIDILEHE
ncbi:ABC transporter permease [Fulvivirgaceae bacterium BMA12]|uniref:ABC transporter permease n=1 Tax=Agaribacillus aureus TaxID=3051825 RepID=A0ABT8L5T1_9BACT|nr:ABC transporter permease [Fulvivirgaceae bacterium BMA12]